MERPIILKPHEVRAILEGRQTQLRRIVKRQPEEGREMKPRRNRAGNIVWMSWRGKPEDANPETGIYGAGWDLCKCPYGQPGDRLWARETWGVGTRPCPFEGSYDGIEYRADVAMLESDSDNLDCYKVNTPDDVDLCDYAGKWRPSIHMPRWASRILLEIVSVRVERLNDISEADAKSEGIFEKLPQWWGWQNDGYHGASAKTAFGALWCSINGPGSWDANPWVWVVEFKRVAS